MDKDGVRHCFERLHEVQLEWDPRASACVVLAAPGYPGTPKKGDAIHGLEKAATIPDSFVFHAGTAHGPEGQGVTSGGRVLGVTALGDTVEAAVSRAYAAADEIDFPGVQLRRDIGRRAIARGA